MAQHMTDAQLLSLERRLHFQAGRVAVLADRQSERLASTCVDAVLLISEVRRLNSTLATMAALGKFFKLIDFMAPRHVNVWTVAIGAEFSDPEWEGIGR